LYADCCSLQTRAPASGKTQHRCARPNVPSSSRVITLSISISLSVGAKMKTAPVDVQINQENWLVLMRTKKKKEVCVQVFCRIRDANTRTEDGSWKTAARPDWNYCWMFYGPSRNIGTSGHVLRNTSAAELHPHCANLTQI
jgi:hypothetical protein